MLNIEVEDDRCIIFLIFCTDDKWLIENFSTRVILKYDLHTVCILRIKTNNRDFNGLRNTINEIRCIGKIYAGWTGRPFCNSVRVMLPTY
ncbi:Uncharacterised protein [Enterobacter hormaechei]|nr:Uncharacterised protein [Enterobacter hormaechei]